MSPSGNDDFWLELDFDTSQPEIGLEQFIFASIMFPNQEGRFVNNNIITIEIMKYVFRILHPLLVCWNGLAGLRSLVSSRDIPKRRWGDGFLVVDTELLPNIPQLSSLEVHHAEYLDGHTLWINSPTGLGNEYPSFAEIEVEIDGVVQIERRVNSDLSQTIQRSNVRHSQGMDALLKQIDFQRVFPSLHP